MERFRSAAFHQQGKNRDGAPVKGRYLNRLRSHFRPWPTVGDSGLCPQPVLSIHFVQSVRGWAGKGDQVSARCGIILSMLCLLAPVSAYAQDGGSMAGTVPGSEQLPNPDDQPKTPANNPDNSGAVTPGDGSAPDTSQGTSSQVSPTAETPSDGYKGKKFPGFDENESAASRGEGLQPVGNPEPSIRDGLWDLLWGFLALLIVFAAVIWWLRRNPATRKYFGGGPVKVLTRAYLAPRQAVYLVKVGERVILVGSGNEGMRTLLEIADQGEVNRLMAQVEEANPQSMTNTFRQALATATPSRPSADPPPVARRTQAAPEPEADNGAIKVDPGYSAKLKLAALRNQMERKEAGT